MHLNTILTAKENPSLFRHSSDVGYSSDLSWNLKKKKEKKLITTYTKKNEYLRVRFLVFPQWELSCNAPGSYSITIRKSMATADHRLSVTSRPPHEITHFSALLLAACLSGLLVNRMAPPNLLL